jgi:hypothetical protein
MSGVPRGPFSFDFFYYYYYFLWNPSPLINALLPADATCGTSSTNNPPRVIKEDEFNGLLVGHHNRPRVIFFCDSKASEKVSLIRDQSVSEL